MRVKLNLYVLLKLQLWCTWYQVLILYIYENERKMSGASLLSVYTYCQRMSFVVIVYIILQRLVPTRYE